MMQQDGSKPGDGCETFDLRNTRVWAINSTVSQQLLSAEGVWPEIKLVAIQPWNAAVIRSLISWTSIFTQLRTKAFFF